MADRPWKLVTLKEGMEPDLSLTRVLRSWNAK